MEQNQLFKKRSYKSEIQLYGEKIHIVSNSNEIISDIFKIYYKTISKTNRVNPKNAIYVIKNKTFNIYYNDNLLYSNKSYSTNLLFLEWFINSLFLKKLDYFFHIHAGAVSTKDTGMIFPATNEVGKSTFTLYLAQRGFHYYSDEIGLIDLKMKKVFPFPKSISLIKKEYDKVSRQGDNNDKDRFKTIRNSEKAFYQPEVRDKDLVHGAHLKYIFFLKREKEMGNPLAKCSKGEGLIELVKNSFNPLTHGEQSFNQLTNLIDKIKIYFLDVSNLEKACKSIREIIIL